MADYMIPGSHERISEPQSHVDSIPSKAAVAGHPIHPMLIPFPIAFLGIALVTDIVYWSVGDPFWARASLWLIGAGIVSAVLAAVAGLVDFLGVKPVRQFRAAWIHVIGNGTVVALAVVNLLLRLDSPAEAVVPSGFVLSLITTGLLVVTGWYGGELAYRHRVGVMSREEYEETVRRRGRERVEQVGHYPTTH